MVTLLLNLLIYSSSRRFSKHHRTMLKPAILSGSKIVTGGINITVKHNF